MQFNTNSKFIISSLYLWALVYVPVARNHEEMAVSPKVNFLFLPLFSFVENYLSFMEAGYDTYKTNFFKLKNSPLFATIEYSKFKTHANY